MDHWLVHVHRLYFRRFSIHEKQSIVQFTSTMQNQYIYTYIHTYIHTNTYKYIQIHTNTYKYIQIHTNTYKYIQIHTNTYKYIQIHTNTYKYIQIHTNTYKYIYTNTYTQIHTQKDIHRHIHRHIHGHLHESIHIHISVILWNQHRGTKHKKTWMTAAACRNSTCSLQKRGRIYHGPVIGTTDLEAGLLILISWPHFWVQNLAPILGPQNANRSYSKEV